MSGCGFREVRAFRYLKEEVLGPVNCNYDGIASLLWADPTRCYPTPKPTALNPNSKRLNLRSPNPGAVQSMSAVLPTAMLLAGAVDLQSHVK